LSAEERTKHLRYLTRTDLYFLLRYVLKRKDIERPWLFDRCKEVQNNPNGYLDLWAREHYKSTIITFGKTIQDILASHGEDALTNREETFGIFSHTRPIAKGFLRQIKSEFETNEELKELFPDVLYLNPRKESPKWSEDDGIVVKRKSNQKEATVEAWGIVDGQPTGKHFFACIYDDIVTKESVTTPDMINKTTDSLALSYNLGSDGGKRRFIGTRYHYNDSYRAVIDRLTATPRIYAATEDGTVEGVPVLLTPERLAEKRRNEGPYIFACQMLQNPVADEAQGFKEEWLRYYDTVTRTGLNVYILIDPANEKKKTNDYTCGWVVGLGSDQKIRVLDIVRDRLNLKERTDLLMRWHRNYKPLRDGVRYEKYGKDADIEHIKSRMAEENYDFDVIEVGGSTPKNDRIKRLLPYFEQGRVLMPRTLHYTDYQKHTRDLIRDFIQEEYKAFPVPVHDDMLDALARLLEPSLSLTWPKIKNQSYTGITSSVGQSNLGWMQ
jgi:predicted phage terminase large subunit-like protein